jgi:hypothetical protein
MTTRKPPVKVEPGQIWADKDRRHKGRTCRVIETDGHHAMLEVVTEADALDTARSTVGRRNRVLVDELGVRGYRLVSQTGQESTR